MNNKHIQDLTLRLSQALDQNYDVINMDAVISVISALEGTTITKEQLETTRLAKYINQLRRRTRSEQLARRAKSLLKKWREMVGIQQQQQPQTQSSGISPYVSTLLPSGIQKNLISVRDTSGKYHQQNLSVTSAGSSSNTITSASNCPTTVANNSSISVFCSQLSSNIKKPIINSNISTLSANSTKKNNNSNNNISSKRFDINKSISAVRAGEIMESSSSEQCEAKHKRKSDEPPTSFEHIFNDFSNNDNNKNYSGLDHYQSSPLFKKKLPCNQFGTIIEQSTSNSNETFSLLETSPQSQIDTIVIDIQDSNSGSNVIAPTLATLKNSDVYSKNSSKYTFSSFASTISQTSPSMISKSDTMRPSFSCNFSSANTSNVTTKRIKKDKKRSKVQIRLEEVDKEVNILDEHSSLDQIQTSTTAATLMNIEETCHQNSSKKEKEDNFYHTSLNDKDAADTSSTCYPVKSNISDILSLSNSSMNSMFPNHLINTEASTIVDDKFIKVQKADDVRLIENNIENLSNPSNVTLSFAGKFKRNKGQEIFIDNFSSQSLRNTEVENIENTTFCENSNDSVSLHSRMSLFEVNNKNGNEHLNKMGNSVGNLSSVSLGNADNNRLENSQEQIYLNTMHHINTNINLKEIPVEKIPKKRGRKKGSRGVDSVIAKEASLTSQMLLSSLGLGGKKVKTTKEIYNEMQNRKLILNVSTPSAILSTNIANSSNNSIGSLQLQPLTSRPTSSCSELSLYSPHTMDGNNTTMCSGSALHVRGTPENYVINSSTVGLDSESDTTTSGEPSKDSLITYGNSESQKMLRRTRGISIDSNSNTHLKQQLNETTLSSVISEDKIKRDLEETLDTTKNQLNKLLTKFQCIPCINKIEFDCGQDLVPCTCKIIEISLKKDKKLQLEVKQKHDGVGDHKEKRTGRHLENEIQQNENNKLMTTASSNAPLSKTSTATLLSTKISPLTETVQPQKPKKSIFDLDFEDEEDPLHKIVAEATAIKHNSLIKISEPDIQQPEQPNSYMLNTNKDLRTGQILEKQSPIKEQQTQLLTNSIKIGNDISSNDECITQLPLPMFEIEEDPNCLAKLRFALQTQNITEFHINTLHNCYIANVNGNWDDSNNCNHHIKVIPDFIHKTCKLKSNIKSLISESSNVVPKYGSLIREDRIRKDLSHVVFAKTFDYHYKIDNFSNKWQTPFLGVIIREKEEKQRNINDCKVRQKGRKLSFHEECKYKIYTRDENETTIISLDTNEINKNTLMSTSIIKSEKNRLQTNLSILEDIVIDVNLDGDIASKNRIYEPSSIGEIICNNNVERNNNLLAIANMDKNISSNRTNNSCPKETKLISLYPIEQIECVTNSCSNMEIHSTNIANNLNNCVNNLSNSSYRFEEDGTLQQGALLQKMISVDNTEGRKRKREKEKSRNYNKNAFVYNKKPRLVKRLKITLNGDIEMISLDSCNDSNGTNNSEHNSNLNFHNIESGKITTANNNEKIKLYSNEIIDEHEYNTSCNTYKEDKLNEHFKNQKKNIYKILKNKFKSDKELHNFENDSEDDSIKYKNGISNELNSKNDCDEKYTCPSDCHKIMTQDISATTVTTSNNHIVLTIKKIPSENSLTNTIPLPPINTNTVAISNTSNLIENYSTGNSVENTNVSLQTVTGKPEPSDIIDRTNFEFSNALLRRSRNVSTHRKIGQLNLFGCSDDDFSKNEWKKDNKKRKRHNPKKIHHTGQEILNASSCSSSYDGNSDFEYANNSSDSYNIIYDNSPSPKVVDIQNQGSIDDSCNKINTAIILSNNCKCSNCSWTKSSDNILETNKTINKPSCELQTTNTSEICPSPNSHSKMVMVQPNDNNDFKSKNFNQSPAEKVITPNCLPIENNGMLISFNNIELMELHKPTDGQDVTKTGYDTNNKRITHKTNAHSTNGDEDFKKIKNKLEIYSNNNSCDGHLYDSCINSSNINFTDYTNYNVQQQSHEEQSAKISTNNMNTEFKERQLSSFGNSANSYNNCKSNYNKNFTSKTDNNEHDKNSNSEYNENDNTNTNNNNNNISQIAHNSIMYDNDNTNNVNFTLSANNATNNTSDNSFIAKSQQQPLTNEQKLNSSIESNKLPSDLSTKDYRTGQRNVDVDVIDNKACSSNCTHIQLFKEWHEMLQLRSYNNDLLTVLPYVVLE